MPKLDASAVYFLILAAFVLIFGAYVIYSAYKLDKKHQAERTVGHNVVVTVTIPPDAQDNLEKCATSLGYKTYGEYIRWCMALGGHIVKIYQKGHELGELDSTGELLTTFHLNTKSTSDAKPMLTLVKGGKGEEKSN